VAIPEGEKILKIYLYVSTESTNVTDGQRPHDGIGCACINNIARQKSEN